MNLSTFCYDTIDTMDAGSGWLDRNTPVKVLTNRGYVNIVAVRPEERDGVLVVEVNFAELNRLYSAADIPPIPEPELIADALRAENEELRELLEQAREEAADRESG